MNDITKIISKVHFSMRLEENMDNIEEKINDYKEYLENTYEIIPVKYKSMYLESFIITITSQIDELIRSLLLLLYKCYPEKIGKSKIDVKEIINRVGIYDQYENIAMKKINEILYSTFKEQVDIINDEMLDSSVDNELLEKIIELKATRDLIAHGEKKYNATYNRKVTEKYKRSNNMDVDVTYDYTNKGIENIESFIKYVRDNIKKGFLTYKRIDAMRDLWNNSVMNKFMDFNDAWDVYENDDSLEPTEKFINMRRYSSSEIEVKNFFLGIYGGLQNSSLDIQLYLLKWPSNTYEGAMLLAWLQDPFTF